MNAQTPIAAPSVRQITLAQATAIHQYAKSLGFHGNVQIILAAAACIDALNGDGWEHLEAHEDELFELIDARADAGSFYAAMRSAGK